MYEDLAKGLYVAVKDGASTKIDTFSLLLHIANLPIANIAPPKQREKNPVTPAPPIEQTAAPVAPAARRPGRSQKVKLAAASEFAGSSARATP